MSKFGCCCGEIIVDRDDFLPHKGYILKDQDREAFFERVSADVGDYINAVREDRTELWYAAHPSMRDQSDASVAHHLTVRAWHQLYVEVYECTKCGRLWVRKGTETQEYASFVREEPGERVLPSEHYRTPSH